MQDGKAFAVGTSAFLGQKFRQSFWCEIWQLKKVHKSMSGLHLGSFNQVDGSLNYDAFWTIMACAATQSRHYFKLLWYSIYRDEAQFEAVAGRRKEIRDLLKQKELV